MENDSIYIIISIISPLYPIKKSQGNDDLSQISARGVGRDFYWPPWPYGTPRNYTVAGQKWNAMWQMPWTVEVDVGMI